MTTINAARAARQDRVLPLAAAWGLPWESDEVELVAGTLELDVEEVALTLERTVYAVLAIRQALRDGRQVGGGHGHHAAAPVKVCGCHQLALTGFGECPLD